MLCVPDLMSAYQQGAIDLEGVQAVQLAMIAHCELMGDRVAILDAPPGLNAQQIKEWRVEKAGYDSKYATLYWPWVKVFDPRPGPPVSCPARGHMAGIWARSDDTRGVHKAPGQRGGARRHRPGAAASPRPSTTSSTPSASTASAPSPAAASGSGARARCPATRSGATSTSAGSSTSSRSRSSRGPSGSSSSPTTTRLWDSVRRTINAFLRRVWRSGALFGATAEEAFFVKCDAENNPQDSIDAGQLIIDIGIAPVKPAEFVIFRIAQFAGGAALTE